MHLKTVTLRNFRCFKELKLNLHPRLTVLVAENGGGKSAVLDGIAIGLSPVLRYFSPTNRRVPFPGPAIKDTDFRLERLEGLIDIDRWESANYAQIVMESTDDSLIWDVWSGPKQSGREVGQSKLTFYASNTLESFKTSNPSLLPVFAYYGATRGLIVIPERLRESKFDYSHPTSALVGALESLSDFKEMLKWFDLTEVAELRAGQGSFRDTSGENFVRHSSLQMVREAIGSILGDTYVRPRFNEKHKFVIFSEVDRLELQVSQLSQGYQSMLALGMDFARRLALANSHLSQVNSDFDWSEMDNYVNEWAKDDLAHLPVRSPAWAPAIMLVDEIDLHLHPSWQQRVLSDLMRTFPGTQFIVTTHSPQVISTVPSESIRIIKDGVVYAATPGTDGAESQRILEEIFQVSPRPQQTPMAQALDQYLRLVDARQWDSPQARELRHKLDAWSQGYEPKLLEADLAIENMKWEAGQ